MKIFTTKQIAKIDQLTIQNEPISDVDLMERAAKTIADYIISETDFKGAVFVCCGPGNNGGDGLAVARMLANIENRFRVTVLILDLRKDSTGSSKINFNRLKEQQKAACHFITDQEDFPPIPNNCLVIDALFGSGLSRPLDGIAASMVRHINQSNVKVISIDIPSGLMGEDNTGNIRDNIIKADRTLTFQFPKLSFLFPENEIFIGELRILDIGLHPNAISAIPSSFYLSDDNAMKKLIKQRPKFSHKGNFGHALLIAGSYGKMGAAVLGSKACLRSGVGLLTTHVPCHAYGILQTSIPEAMMSIDESDILFTGLNNPADYSAIGVGPGIGQKVNTVRGLSKLLEDTRQPIVIDADALNILGQNRELLNKLPVNSVLTPHPLEFERLTDAVKTGFERMNKAIEFAMKYRVVLVVKGAYTMIINTNGDVWFNTTGNPGMATAGSGDVLTGIILGLLAQAYPAFDAARLGVYLHGLAGDLAANQKGFEALIASDIIENLGEAFKLIHK